MAELHTTFDLWAPVSQYTAVSQILNFIFFHGIVIVSSPLNGKINDQESSDGNDNENRTSVEEG